MAGRGADRRDTSGGEGPLGGTTIKVAAAPGALSDHGLFTNLALRAAAHPKVVAAVTGSSRKPGRRRGRHARLFVGVNLVVARVGVAVGVLGMETLGANRPSHFGIDKAITPGSPSRPRDRRFRLLAVRGAIDVGA